MKDEEITCFEQLELSSEILKAVSRMGFMAPTPVQAQTIPLMRQGSDIIAKAPTGTGKTCAFGIPLLEGLRDDTDDIQAAVVCPTRELCIQIAEELRQLAAFLPGVRIAAVYGGQPIARQLTALKKRPHIVVATPGRLLDHMSRGTVWLGNLYTAVLDEADEMLKMGFIRDVRRILNATPADTQVVMFSATISREVMDVAWEYQHNAAEVQIAAEGDSRPRIAQFQLMSSGSRRTEDMLRIVDLLDLHRVMVFGNRKSTVRQLGERLRRQGRSVDCLHGDIPQSQRNRVMSAFREGRFEILVATDVAARGIDVDDVEAVFNYDIPDENEYYLHRIGRTGRAKRHGMAFTFMTPDDRFRLRDIRKYTHSELWDIHFDDRGRLISDEGADVEEIARRIQTAGKD
ncbi:MAG: DEAD/DEAH box helicase [Clostridiales bacterium]|nr:DEAD/DEAH box helicase [Clostridiales bacterium]